MTKEEAIKLIRDAAWQRLSKASALKNLNEIERAHLIGETSGLVDAANLLEEQWKGKCNK